MSAKLKQLAPKGLTPYSFQLQAVEHALQNPKCYLALDPGLGKTIVAAMISNALDATAFYVCPPFLETNTQTEFAKWRKDPKLYTIPDSMITKREKCLTPFKRKLRETQGEKILFIDEAHRFKNPKAQRTKALFNEIAPHFDRVVFLSGTPMPNSRPVELWPVLLNAAPGIFGTNFFRYGMKYCGAFHNGHGWDFNGFSNRKEFRARIKKSFMLRMKKDVLDLPAKMEGLLTMGEGLPAKIQKIERDILKEFSEEDLVEGEIASINGKGELHLATYLRLLGEYKLKYMVPYLKEELENSKESILIFGVHKATIAKLKEELAEYQPLVITGEVPKEKRKAIVNEFQENPNRRVFLGNVQACGVGFTLTKATRVIFTEFSWVDGDNSQAADRAHRIGQTGTVQVQYAVLKDSIDARRMEVLLRKRRLSI